jgi:hypothetical protein
MNAARSIGVILPGLGVLLLVLGADLKLGRPVIRMRGGSIPRWSWCPSRRSRS